jgi:hypothetical protein
MFLVRLHRFVWISPGLWFCGRSEIKSKSMKVFVPLSPSLVHDQPWPGIKLVISAVFIIYPCSYLLPCGSGHPQNFPLLFGIGFQVDMVGIIYISPISLSPFLFPVSCSLLHTYSPEKSREERTQTFVEYC